MKIDGYTVLRSTRKNKKYDVYSGNKYILSFGALGYQQYKDRIGLYSEYDHEDETRREAFNRRFKKLIELNKDNPQSSMYWSSKYLW